MHRNDRRLQGVGPDAAAGQGPLDQAEPLDDQSTIPQSAVLLVEPHQFAAGRDPRLAPRVVQQHQGEQAEGLSGSSSTSRRPTRIASPLRSARVRLAPVEAE